MKSFHFQVYCALKLAFTAALLVVMSDLARAEMASIYGGRDGLCGRPTASGERLNCAGMTEGASNAGIWLARPRLPQRVCDGSNK